MCNRPQTHPYGVKVTSETSFMVGFGVISTVSLFIAGLVCISYGLAPEVSAGARFLVVLSEIAAGYLFYRICKAVGGFLIGL